MPCRYEEPEDYDNVRGEAKLVASSLLSLDKNKVYVLTNSDTLKCERIVDYDDYHESQEFLKFGTPQLCTAIKQLTEEQLNIFVYDGRNPQARKLATWWEKHQEQDRQRIKREETKEKENAERLAAIKKLTPRERRLLNIDGQSDTHKNIYGHRVKRG